MKKFLPIMLCMMVLLAVPASGSMVASSLSIALAGQSPQPVEPGNNIQLDIYIQNTGYGNAEEVVIEIRPEYPFTVILGDSIKKFTNIGPTSSVRTSYTLYVNDSALTNTYEIEFYVYSNNTPSAVVKEKIPISVRGDPKLILTGAEVSPREIEPGSIVNIRTGIKNVGTGKARQIELGLNSSSEYLVPVLAKGSAYLEELGPGSETEIEFEISIDISADYKTYMTSITMDYKDETNAENQVIFDLGIPVKGTINLDIINTEANYEREKLRIEVANKGTSEAKSLEAKLIIGGEIVGIDYLTSLKANKHTTFDFPLMYQGSGELVIDYIGPGIEKNQLKEDIVLNFDKPNGGNGSMLTWAAGVIIALVVIYIIYRKLRKKKP